MVKASTLYIVIIIALVIGVLCSALIVGACFYRAQYQLTFRHDRLENNLTSGINLLLTSPDSEYLQTRMFSLFSDDNDSVILRKLSWGIYDIGITKAFIQGDTILKVFSVGYRVDSTKWCALYLEDEDRPLGLSGKTTIRGDAYIPVAGVKTTYVNNRFYEGDKRLVRGTKHNSQNALPALNEGRLKELENIFGTEHGLDSSLLASDTVTNTFLSDPQIANFGNQVHTIQHIDLDGNIILYSDTTLIIDSTATLNNVLVFAKSIHVNNGFHGTCQLFATDTINVGKRCEFGYPSCIGLLRFSPAKDGLQVKIIIGDDTRLSGIIFNYEKKPTIVKPVINLGKGVEISGQVYSQGYVELSDKGVTVFGSVFTKQFLYETVYSRYENYLIGATLDSKALSPYYLTSILTPVADKKKKKILQWLEQK